MDAKMMQRLFLRPLDIVQTILYERATWLIALPLMLLWLGGCASMPNDPDEEDVNDAAEPFNRSMFDFNEGLDRVVLKPVSTTYVNHVPQTVRTGVSNFYDNLLYLDTVLNDFLQGKLTQGVSDLGRFGINSTIGIIGLFDVATPMGLKKHNEDFGQTLAVWHAGDGSYLVYPLLGPSSVRDTGGIVVGLLTNPVVYAVPPVAIPLGILSVVDLRARKEGFVKFRDAAALDPYSFTRESYRQNRVYEIYDGNPPRPVYDKGGLEGDAPAPVVPQSTDGQPALLQFEPDPVIKGHKWGEAAQPGINASTVPLVLDH